jgi:hypothetical protein
MTHWIDSDLCFTPSMTCVFIETCAILVFSLDDKYLTLTFPLTSGYVKMIHCIDSDLSFIGVL